MKVGDFVRGKPGCPNVGIYGIVVGTPRIVFERFSLDKHVMMVKVKSFRNGENWVSDSPIGFLEVLSEAR